MFENVVEGTLPNPRTHLRNLRVVVADDDEDTVLTLTALLQSEGHEVRGVHSGKSACDALDDFNPDVLMLDISMPGLMSGYDAAVVIRRARPGTRPVLIGMSGHFKSRGQFPGFDHYLSKPFDLEELLRLLIPLRLSSQ